MARSRAGVAEQPLTSTNQAGRRSGRLSESLVLSGDRLTRFWSLPRRGAAPGWLANDVSAIAGFRTLGCDLIGTWLPQLRSVRPRSASSVMSIEGDVRDDRDRDRSAQGHAHRGG